MAEVKVSVWMTNPVAVAKGNSDPSFYPDTEHSTMDASGWLKVGIYTVTFEPPAGASIAPKVIEVLRNKIQEVRAEAELKATNLEREIQNLLAIGYSPAGEKPWDKTTQYEAYAKGDPLRHVEPSGDPLDDDIPF